MTRLRVWLDNQLRIDTPADRADLARLDAAVASLERDCLRENRRLVVVATCESVECVLTRI